MQTSNTRNRGFASMDRHKQREIARKGGKAAHEKGTAHRFTSEEARAAGRKGGESVSANRAHMAEIGRLGGKRSAIRRQSSSQPEEPSAGGAAGGEAEHEAHRMPEQQPSPAAPGEGAM